MWRAVWVVTAVLASGVAFAQDAIGIGGSGLWKAAGDYGDRTGSARAPASVQAALAWLATQGDPEDGWGTIDATSLATLACLATGDYDRVGEAREVAFFGLRSLTQVHQARGDGRFADDDASHALATLVVTDAYALSGRFVVKKPSRKGVEALVAILRELPERDASGDDARSHPLMLAGLGLQALHAAQHANLHRDVDAVTDTIAWIDATLETGVDAPRAAVAAALLGVILHDRTRERVADSALVLEKRGGLEVEGDALWAMHAASVLRQLEPIDADAWTAWHDVLARSFESSQVGTGDDAGSWSSPADALDRVETTAAHAIALLAPMRYAAITRAER